MSLYIINFQFYKLKMRKSLILIHYCLEKTKADFFPLKPFTYTEKSDITAISVK